MFHVNQILAELSHNGKLFPFEKKQNEKTHCETFP